MTDGGQPGPEDLTQDLAKDLPKDFEERALGLVVGGSLAHGVEVRLDDGGQSSVEDIKVGTFVTIQGSKYRFFGVVTDLALGSSDPRLKHSPPEVADPFSRWSRKLLQRCWLPRIPRPSRNV